MSKTKTIVVFTLLLTIPGLVAAQDSTSQQEKTIAELQAKIEKLEVRVAELEKKVADDNSPSTQPAQASANARAPQSQIEQLKARARARMRKDREKYSQEQIAEAERLYQVANKNWRSPEAKQALQQLVEEFPDLDRTGCAVLYLGQTSEGDERETLLKQAIEKYGDCFYGNGVQVGAYGRYLLALYYSEKGDSEKAKALFEEIRKNYPTAIDHSGRPLMGKLPQ